MLSFWAKSDLVAKHHSVIEGEAAPARRLGALLPSGQGDRGAPSDWGLAGRRSIADYCSYAYCRGKLMLSIVYVSVATKPMSEDNIVAILVQSRANNTRLGLTGALLCHRQRFIQILEGEEKQVLTKYRTISLDPRHRNVHVLSRELIEQRQFPQWTMGFRPLSQGAMNELDGFDEFFGRTGHVQIKHADVSAQLFLEWLGDYWFSATR